MTTVKKELFEIKNNAHLLIQPKPVPGKHVANFFNGNATWGNAQKEEINSWVARQKAEGFEVYYQNQDGTTGKL